MEQSLKEIFVYLGITSYYLLYLVILVSIYQLIRDRKSRSIKSFIIIFLVIFLVFVYEFRLHEYLLRVESTFENSIFIDKKEAEFEYENKRISN